MSKRTIIQRNEFELYAVKETRPDGVEIETTYIQAAGFDPVEVCDVPDSPTWLEVEVVAGVGFVSWLDMAFLASGHDLAEEHRVELIEPHGNVLDTVQFIGRLYQDSGPEYVYGYTSLDDDDMVTSGELIELAAQGRLEKLVVLDDNEHWERPALGAELFWEALRDYKEHGAFVATAIAVNLDTGAAGWAESDTIYGEVGLSDYADVVERVCWDALP